MSHRHMSNSSAKPRRVWIVNHYAQTRRDIGGLTRHYDFATHLEKHGWKATVIAARTSHPSGRNRRPVLLWPKRELIDGVEFLWVPSVPYSGNGVTRILNMIVFFLLLLLPWATRAVAKPDVVVGSSPHPLSAAAGALLAKRYKTPFIYEVRDLWPEALITMGRISREGVVARAMLRLERWLYTSATSVIGLWPLLSNYTDSIGLEDLRTDWISNGVDPDRFYPEPKVPRNETFTLMYFGAHGGANDLENVVRAMALVGTSSGGEGISLRLIGDGPNKPGLVALSNELGCQNIRFEASVKKGAIPELAAEADAFVFNLVDAQMFRFGISPNKLFEYMAAARPVLFSCDAASNPIDKSKGGVSVPPNNPAALAEAILDLARKTPQERALMGDAGRKFVEENFRISHLAQRYAACLDGAIAEPASGGRTIS